MICGGTSHWSYDGKSLLKKSDTNILRLHHGCMMSPSMMSPLHAFVLPVVELMRETKRARR